MVTCDVCCGGVQVLWQPELKKVFMDLMDTSGAEITMLPANFFGPPGRTLSFGDVANVNSLSLSLARSLARSLSLSHIHTHPPTIYILI